MKTFWLALAMLVAGCAPFPRDAAGTTERIERAGVMQVGVVAGTADWSDARRIAERLAADHGATTSTQSGPASLLLRDLDEGRVDLVVGEFGRSGPVSREVSLSQAVGQPEPRDGKLPVLRLARKKGENGLITASDKMVMQ